ncbi:hypothetical protein WOLCODRAFT_49096, partial [Wolfiporia cocos MD-104 SS10]
PSPIGGIPFAIDFAPSILFAVLHGLLAPAILNRWIRRKSRYTSLTGSMFLCLHRIIELAIRALQAHSTKSRVNPMFIVILQTAYTMGSIAYGAGLYTQSLYGFNVQSLTDHEKSDAQSLRSMYEGDTRHSREAVEEVDSLDSDEKSGHTAWRERLYRRLFYAARIHYHVLNAMAAASGTLYIIAMGHDNPANNYSQHRYVSCAGALLLLQATNAAAIFGYMRFPGIPRASALFLSYMACLLSIPTVYRLLTMTNMTMDILSTAPGTLNTPLAKAAFYVFFIAPDWICAVCLMSVYVHEMLS